MNRILILFAHPALERSRVQARLADAARQIDHLSFHDLYDHYPDLMIDRHHEQQLLRDHDIILFQHPLYWYSTPAIMKEWQDLVLTHGFAYGQGGTALHGKWVGRIISTGGSESAYTHNGQHRFGLHELLLPLTQAFSLVGMQPLPPFVVHGTSELDDPALDQVASQYRQILQGLQQGVPDRESLLTLRYLNNWSG